MWNDDGNDLVERVKLQELKTNRHDAMNFICLLLQFQNLGACLTLIFKLFLIHFGVVFVVFVEERMVFCVEKDFWVKFIISVEFVS